ncbi:uncharacterized protein OCT59_000569 [Rhizophagus irregularis]|uniref:uncharacterized protein n=1 Tax=Rhizophagus irregularis TaxID=588596 RepID=UPI00331A4A22|nr:hypothetical protein OCT59_000569 [Rhizophagus irregularis]
MLTNVFLLFYYRKSVITNPIENRYNESHRESGISSDRCIYQNPIRNLLQPGYRIPDKISVLVVFLILYF